jgi:hypothetical protein
MAPRQTQVRESADQPTATVAAVEVDVYARLAAPFDSTFRDNRGGVDLEYVTGEQVVSRLNEVLGVENWSFRVLEHGINVEADEAWALGEIVAEIEGKPVTRQQFGSQKLKRSRSTGAPLDIGFDLKGSGTDALKKCASLLGVALYLSKKEAPEARGAMADVGRGELAAVAEGGPHACEVCGQELKETRFKDGTTWGPAQLAGYGRRKHGRVLCMEHYRAANDARKSALLSA